MGHVNGWLGALVVFFGFGPSLGVNVFVEPDEELGLGLAVLSGSRAVGPLQLQVGAEAEWDLHDATLVPLDIALVRNQTLAPWLSIYGGVATNLTFERLVRGLEASQTSFGFAAAFRVGASIQTTDWLSLGLDIEYAVPLERDPTPELIVELGPSFSF
jgi:hypothetical protein